MNMRKTAWIICLTMGLVLFSAVVWYSDKQKNMTEIQTLKQEITTLTSNKSDVKQENKKLSDAYEKLYKEKNGTAKEQLLQATNDLFSAVYNYDTSNENERIKDRKASVSKLTEEAALDALFPKDADKGTPSVTTISKLEQTPSIYLMSSDATTQVAIVEVHYVVSIAGSDDQTGALFYKVSYDPLKNTFTKIKNIGEVPL